MGKLIKILLIVLVTAFVCEGAETIHKFEGEVKGIVTTLTPSLVKVVAESEERYVATGIAVEPNLVISSVMLIGQPYDRLYVETSKGERYTAALAGKDRPSGIVLLKIDKNALKPVTMAGGVQAGDWSALVGAFYNQFPAVAQGLVSSVNDDELILNATAAPGSAGGAVVNKKGELVGVIRGSLRFSFLPDWVIRDSSSEIVVQNSRGGKENLCYAVPAARVREIAEQLKRFGYIRRGWVGVGMALRAGGVVVDEVSTGSPAARAGLSVSDKVLAVNDFPVKNLLDVGRVVRNAVPGSRLKFRVERRGQQRTLEAVVGEMPPGDEATVVAVAPGIPDVFDIDEFRSAMPPAHHYVFNLNSSTNLGVDTLDMTPELAETYQVREKFGLLVARVSPNSSSARAGLKVGDVLVRAKGVELRSLSQLRQVLNSLKNGETLHLQVYRDGKSRTVGLVPESDGGRGYEAFDVARAKVRGIPYFSLDSAEVERVRAEVRKQYEAQLKVLQAELKELRRKLQQAQKDAGKGSQPTGR